MHRCSLALILALGCSGGSGTGAPIPVEPVSSPQLVKVVVNTTPHTLFVGETGTAVVSGWDQSDKAFSIGTVVWSSSMPGIATVSQGGVITAMAPGIVTISASTGGIVGGSSVAVIAPPAPAHQVIVSPASTGIHVGERMQLAAKLLDPAGVPQIGLPVTWASVSPGIAGVSSDGTVHGVDVGTTVVTATIAGHRGTVPVTVLGIPDPEIRIQIIAPRLDQTVEDTLRVSATVVSARPLLRIFIALGQRQVSLHPVKVGPPGRQIDGWGADVDISNEAAGPRFVVFSAYDIAGHFSSETARFDHAVPKSGGGVSPTTGFKLVRPPATPVKWP